MIIKKIAAAAALVAVAAPSFAAIATQGNGELLLVVYDEANQVSYAKDLGVYQNDFKALADSAGFGSSLAAEDGYSRSWSITGDTYWTSFMAASNPANLKWTVLALDSTGGINVNGLRLFTTAMNTTENLANMATWKNDLFTAGTGATQLGTLFSALNASGSHGVSGTAPNYANNGSSINFATDSGNGYFGQPGSGPRYNATASFFNGNAVGTDSQFFYLSRNLSQLDSVTVDAFGNSQHATMLSFNTAGGTPTLSITLQAVSAVPEPSTYGLLLAGLLGIGLVARRRSQD